MAQNTTIAWTDHTFNIAWGCTMISPGCANCYAKRLAERYGYDVWGPNAPRRRFEARHWAEPLAWERKARRSGVRFRVFCSSMCDVFEDHAIIDQERDKLWPLIRQTPSLDWQLLTKRSERIAGRLPNDWGCGYPNVWLGVSIESIEYASRADHLRTIPAAVRFVSYEPALGPLDELDMGGIDWVIYGGESGPRFRKHQAQWAHSMKYRCDVAGVTFFYKQSAGRYPGCDAELDGERHQAFPTPRVSIHALPDMPMV